MFNFVTRSIQRKFVAVLATILVLVNIPAMAIYIHMMNASLQKEFDERNLSILSTNAASLSRPLWDFNYEILPDWAETILVEKSIAAVYIYDDTGKPLASSGDKAEEHAVHTGTHEAAHVVKTKKIYHSVDGKNNLVGRLELHFDRSHVDNSVWLLLSKSLLLLSSSIGAVIVAAVIANRYLIARPLEALTNAIDATQETGRKHLVPVKSQDEVGRVSQKFNEMQDQLSLERERILLANERLNDRHNHTPSLLYSLDQEGKIHAVSDFWLSATGYFEEEVIGKHFAEFLSEATLDDFLQKTSFLELKPGEFSEVTCQFRKRDGSFMDVLVRESIDLDTLTNDVLSLSVMTDITSLKKAEETLRMQAETDSLTGLLNREGVTNVIHQSLIKAQSKEEGAALAFLDLDRFKWVNDNLGHAAGDELLQSVADRLRWVTRPNEYVGRFGGDEFAIVVEGPNAADRIVELSREIVDSISGPVTIHCREFKVSVSVGISVFPEHASNATDLIRAADVAMYHRKQSGRNGYTVFNRTLGKHAGQFLETEQLISSALANDWFELYLQPIVDLDEDRIAGMEALLRLNHPEHGIMPPAEIIETAEKSGQILDIGDRVIELAFKHMEAFKKSDHLKDCYLTVNFSAAQFLPGLPSKLAAGLMSHGLQAEKLVLEITETVLMQDSDNLMEIFDAISALGARFALDDFGTGYSSLNYLNKFPVSILKIDRSFIQIMAEEKCGFEETCKSLTLVQSMIAMAHQLKMTVVAEGIETQQDADRLTDMGADMGQGYYFSRPVPISAFLGETNEPDLKQIG